MKSSLLASVSLVLSLATVARAQDSASVHVSIHVPDSVAHVTERELPSQARFAIVSRDGQAALLLMDTTIVAQMTDRGLARMNARETTDTISGAVNRMVARMALGDWSRCSIMVSPITCAISLTRSMPMAGSSCFARTARRFSGTSRSAEAR